MEENRKKHDWAASALFTIAFLVFDAASSGPVAFVLMLAEFPEWGWTLFCLCYLPFLFLPHPVSDGFQSWVFWWAEWANTLT